MTASTPSCEYIYAGSSLLAKIEGGVTNYYHPDHLSARVTTDSSGNIAGQQGYYPFGDSWYAQSTTSKWQFTSYEHDPESGNDYALARSYVTAWAASLRPTPSPAPPAIRNPSTVSLMSATTPPTSSIRSVYSRTGLLSTYARSPIRSI